VTSRYTARGREAEFEPGSRGRVLRNLLGIHSVREMERRETEALFLATQHLIDETRPDQRFTAGDIRRIHKLWLGGIYIWAGQYRSVNLTKGSFTFAAAGQIPRLMRELENGALRQFTPCVFGAAKEQAAPWPPCTRSLSWFTRSGMGTAVAHGYSPY